MELAGKTMSEANALPVSMNQFLSRETLQSRISILPNGGKIGKHGTRRGDTA